MSAVLKPGGNDQHLCRRDQFCRVEQALMYAVHPCCGTHGARIGDALQISQPMPVQAQPGKWRDGPRVAGASTAGAAKPLQAAGLAAAMRACAAAVRTATTPLLK
jgi:hypothetical protein